MFVVVVVGVVVVVVDAERCLAVAMLVTRFIMCFELSLLASSVPSTSAIASERVVSLSVCDA